MSALRIVRYLGIVICAMKSTSNAQVTWHSDYGGYSMRFGNSVYSNRNDGSSQEFHRFGNISTYSDSAGTTGESVYLPSGRYDSYRNREQGWTGNGFTPYYAPDASSYRRSYSSQNSEQPQYQYETQGSATVLYPVLQGTTMRDYSRPGYRIEESGGRRIAYPTFPGTSTRDYSANPIDLGASTNRANPSTYRRQRHAKVSPITPSRGESPSSQIEPPTNKVEFRYEREGNDIIAVPLVNGTSIQDFDRPGFRIVERNGRLLAYPTEPGTRLRDFSREPVDLGPVPQN